MFLSVASGMLAQGKVGHWSVIPRIGVDLASVTKDAYYVTARDGYTLEKDAKTRPAFVCGVDAEYRNSEYFSASAGFYYTQQGAKYEDFSIDIDEHSGYGMRNDVLKLDYLSAVLMERGYVTPRFSIGLGLQLSMRVNSSRSHEMQDYTIADDGAKTYAEVEKMVYDMGNVANKVVLHMPLSISYEYQNVVLDARYVYGLTRTFKGAYGKGNNTMLMFTVGYRFNL